MAHPHPPNQHRTLQPSGPPPQSRPRLDDSLDAIRQDFELMTQELNAMRSQRDEYEAKIASQVNELNIIRQSLYDLESQHGKIRQHYEDEINRARAEGRSSSSAIPQGIASLGTNPSSSQSAPPGLGPGAPPGGAPVREGVVGPGMGIPSGPGGPVGPGGPGPVSMGAPPGGMYADTYYGRDRDSRDPRGPGERDGPGPVGRDIRLDSRDGPPPPARPGPQGPGAPGPGGAPPGADRDIIMRDPHARERERGGGDRMPGPGGMLGGERDRGDREHPRERERLERMDSASRGGDGRERLADARDSKRIKTDRDRERGMPGGMDRDARMGGMDRGGGMVLDRDGRMDRDVRMLDRDRMLNERDAVGRMGDRDPRDRDIRISDRDRDRERDARSMTLDRDPRDMRIDPRDRMPGPGGPGMKDHGFSPSLSHPQGHPQHSMGGGMGHPGHPSHHGPPSHHGGPGSGMPTPKLPPPPSSTGPSQGGGGPGGPGYPGGPGGMEGNSLGPMPTSTPGSSHPSLPPSSAPGGTPTHPSSASTVGPSNALIPTGPGAPGEGGPGLPSFPDDIDIHSIPPDLKKEGSDWFAIFNPSPKVKRTLDVALVHTLMHESVVCCVRFSADGKYLATGCNRTAQIYDTKTGVKTCVLADDSAGKSGDLYIRSVCFSPDGKFLATGAEDKQIRIWDIAKKRIRNVFDGHQQEIYSLDFSHDGRLIVSGSGDKTARIWDMGGGPPKVLTINDPDSLNNDAGVTSVAISPDGRWVAAGSLDTVVRIWDVSTGQLVERLRGHRDSVYSVAFTPDGKGLVSGSLDKTLKYWDVSGLNGSSGSGSANGSVKGKKEGSQAPNGGPSGPGASGAVVKKDEKGGRVSECTMNFIGHKDYVLSVAVSHDGLWVVSGSKDRGVQFWDARTAIVQCMLQGHKNSVISIDLSPAGNVLATGSGDWQARIWSYGSV